MFCRQDRQNGLFLVGGPLFHADWVKRTLVPISKADGPFQQAAMPALPTLAGHRG